MIPTWLQFSLIMIVLTIAATIWYQIGVHVERRRNTIADPVMTHRGADENWHPMTTYLKASTEHAEPKTVSDYQSEIDALYDQIKQTMEEIWSDVAAINLLPANKKVKVNA